MKHMLWKRLLAPVLSLVLALSLTACGGTADKPDPVQSGAESNEAEKSLPPAEDTGVQSRPTDGIGAWLPPTDTGLAGTIWETEDDCLRLGPTVLFRRNNLCRFELLL